MAPVHLRPFFRQHGKRFFQLCPRQRPAETAMRAMAETEAPSAVIVPGDSECRRVLQTKRNLMPPFC
jgi:hypothetical protein